MSDDKFNVACKLCGRPTPQTQCGEAIEDEALEFEIGGQEMQNLITWHHILLQCDVCGQISLHVFNDDFEHELQLYPEIKNLSGIPEAIRQAYSEAGKIKNASPTAFLILIRRALEFLCQDKNAEGENLKKQIEYLGTRDIIPKTLSRMSQALRYFGNLGAHATDFKVGLKEAELVEDFFLAIVEYVYIAPEKLKRAEDQVKNLKKK